MRWILLVMVIFMYVSIVTCIEEVIGEEKTRKNAIVLIARSLESRVLFTISKLHAPRDDQPDQPKIHSLDDIDKSSVGTKIKTAARKWVKIVIIVAAVVGGILVLTAIVMTCLCCFHGRSRNREVVVA